MQELVRAAATEDWICTEATTRHFSSLFIAASSKTFTPTSNLWKHSVHTGDFLKKERKTWNSDKKLLVNDSQ